MLTFNFILLYFFCRVLHVWPVGCLRPENKIFHTVCGDLLRVKPLTLKTHPQDFGCKSFPEQHLSVLQWNWKAVCVSVCVCVCAPKLVYIKYSTANDVLCSWSTSIYYLYRNKGCHDFYFNLEIHVNKLEVRLCHSLSIYIYIYFLSPPHQPNVHKYLYMCTCEAHKKEKQHFKVDRANLPVACRRTEQNLLLITVESPKSLFFGWTLGNPVSARSQ